MTMKHFHVMVWFGKSFFLQRFYHFGDYEMMPLVRGIDLLYAILIQYRKFTCLLFSVVYHFHLLALSCPSSQHRPTHIPFRVTMLSCPLQIPTTCPSQLQVSLYPVHQQVYPTVHTPYNTRYFPTTSILFPTHKEQLDKWQILQNLLHISLPDFSYPQDEECR